MSIANDTAFRDLLDVLGYAAHDAKACGGEFGTAGRYAAAEEAVVAYLEVIERRVAAAAKAQHERISRMQQALEEIKCATAGRSSDITVLAVHDMAEAGLRAT